MSAKFFYLSTPTVSGSSATINLHAETTDNPPVVLLHDEPGDEHQVSADPEGVTPEDKADPGNEGVHLLDRRTAGDRPRAGRRRAHPGSLSRPPRSRYRQHLT